MASPIKVNQIRDEREYNPDKTVLNILQQVFGQKFRLTYSGWHGVRFRSMSRPSSFHNYPLMGIQMSVGDYSEKTIKRVMVKDDTIDADAIKAKFAELQAIADGLAKRQKESAHYESRTEQLRARVAKAVNHPDKWNMDCKVHLDSHSPTEVEMKSEVNGMQLVAIERLLGEHPAEIRLVVPEDKAVEVYNILKGNKK